jgi:hypothetical protein
VFYVVTAHFRSSDWIAIQRDYLDRYISEPFKVWGSLEGVDASFRGSFDRVVRSLGGHAGKLNLLASIVCDEADPDDVLIFLDGDAFPVADVVEPVRSALSTTSLVAVQRLENFEDRQPHPCFCATTVGFWRALPGDWSSGYPLRPGWSDVGANLLHRLERTKTEWTPIHRSHSVAGHSLMFGVYGGFLYHHGSGFRRINTEQGDLTPAGLSEPAARRPYERLGQSTIGERLRDPAVKGLVDEVMANQALSEKVYAAIVADPNFFERVLRSGK